MSIHKPELRRREWAVGAGLLGALVLTACAETPKPPVAKPAVAAPARAPAAAAPVQPAAPQYTAAPGLSPRERIRRALDLLGQGQGDQARPEVVAFLQEQPDNELGRSLLSQIDQDPRMLLGAQSYPYVIRSGETVSMLAERFLGDRFKFYALARYNNLTDPSRAEVGQTLMIPGTPRATPPPRPARVRSEEALIAERVKETPRKRAASAPATKAQPTTPQPPRQAAARPAAPSRDPARAQQLRASALELMSRGLVARAVPQLEQALRADPGNRLIVGDLARARRLLGAR